MHKAERHRQILSFLSTKPHASVADLCEVVNASPATVRRDLTSLAEEGRLLRTHGGAEPSPPQGRLQGTPFSRNVLRNVEKKKAIARAAAGLCNEDEAIIMDAGSTTYFMCPYLRGRRLQVLTNSIPIVEELLADDTVRLHLPGGEIFREQNIILSPFESNGVNHYAASKMFMGAEGLSPRGLQQSDTILIQAEQRLTARAEEIIVVADSSKFDREAALILCPLERLSVIVTDSDIKDKQAAMVEGAGVQLMVVEA